VMIADTTKIAILVFRLISFTTVIALPSVLFAYHYKYK